MSDPTCQWCTDLEQRPKCKQTADYQRGDMVICQDIISVKNEETILIDENLDNSILIQPQSVHMNLRPGLVQDLSFSIGQSEEYPVDLYFLFDLSFSMNSSRTTLAEQGGAIIGNITQVTKDLQIGFGSFVGTSPMSSL